MFTSLFAFADLAEKTTEAGTVLAQTAGTAPVKVAPAAQSWNEVLTSSFQNAFHQVIDFAPRIVAMIAVLVIGYVVSRLVARVITLLCEKIGLQRAAEQSGLANSMRHMGIKRNVPAILGTVIYWSLLCVFLMAAFNILQLTGVSAAMGKVVEFIPALLIAMVAVVVGLLIASFLRGVVATSADRLGLSYAEHLANGCYYAIALLTFYFALNPVLVQLNMDLSLLKDLILIAFAGLAIGFGLAFGLGGREVLGGILAGYYVRQRVQAGDHVTVGPMEGIVREVGPVATIIETDEHGLLNRHSVPNTKMLSEAIR